MGVTQRPVTSAPMLLAKRIPSRIAAADNSEPSVGRTRHFLLPSMAVPVGAAVALARGVNDCEDYPQNGREIYADENIVENHIDRLSVDVSHKGGRCGFRSGCSVNSQYHRPPPVQS